jgi:hypothetical protein
MDESVTQHDWWHVIDLPGGQSTPGGWDLRQTTDELPEYDVVVTGSSCSPPC